MSRLYDLCYAFRNENILQIVYERVLDSTDRIVKLLTNTDLSQLHMNTVIEEI